MKDRADKLKNQAKVTKEVLKDPTLTLEEIKNKTWLSIGNIHDKLKNLEKTEIKDDRILWICDKDLEIVTLIQEEIYNRIKQKKDISMWDMIRAADVSTKRYTLFKWDITDKNGWLKLPTITLEQAKAMTEQQRNEERKKIISWQ